MTDTSQPPRQRVLEPMDRIAEALFGVIMVLTFTGSLSVAEAGRDDVNAMLIGAIGCNLAWGIVDAVMFLMACLAERGHNLRLLRAVQAAADPVAGRRVITDALPDQLRAVLSFEEVEAIREKLARWTDPPARPRLRRDDWLGAVGVFLIVFLSTLPVVVPFIFMHQAWLAMRVSNGIAIVMLFLLGAGYGRYAGLSPWRVGVLLVVLGGALVALTIALGG